MQFTIESRELASETTHGTAFDSRSRQHKVEARDVEDAISQYVAENESELVSCTTPARMGESIATVRKDDSVYLVRVYQD